MSNYEELKMILGVLGYWKGTILRSRDKLQFHFLLFRVSLFSFAYCNLAIQSPIYFRMGDTHLA